jgi:oligosaccharide repeat unit polymerase
VLNTTSTKTAPFILGQILLIAAVVWAKVLLDQGGCGAETMVRITCIWLPLQFMWMLYSWSASGSRLFSPYLLFVVSVVVFNAGQAFLECFGMNKNGLLSGLVSENTLAYTLTFVLYSLSVMHLGALIAARRGTSRNVRRPVSFVSPRILRLTAAGLFVISLVPSLMTWGQAARLVADSGYGALYQADTATGFGASYAVMSGFLVPAGFLLLASGKVHMPSRVAACLLISAYVFLQLFLGFRGGAMVVLVAFLWLWHRVIHRLPLVLTMAVLCAIAVFVLPIVGLTRNTAGRERTSLSAYITAYSEMDNPAVSILSELGGSMIAPAYTIQFMPAEHDYELGASYGYALLSLVPNLFWQVHPAAVHSPSKWLVETAEPGTARAGGGLGFSVIAEAYLNFGFLGSALPLGLIGWAVGSLSCWTDKSLAPQRACFVAIALVPLLMYGRAEAGNVIRGVVWYAGIPYLIVNRLQKRHVSKRREVAGIANAYPKSAHATSSLGGGHRPASEMQSR